VKYFSNLAEASVFQGARLLAKPNSQVNRLFFFFSTWGRSHFREQKPPEARREERQDVKEIRLRLRNLAICLPKRKPREAKVSSDGRGPEARGGF